MFSLKRNCHCWMNEVLMKWSDICGRPRTYSRLEVYFICWQFSFSSFSVSHCPDTHSEPGRGRSRGRQHHQLGVQHPVQSLRLRDVQVVRQERQSHQRGQQSAVLVRRCFHWRGKLSVQRGSSGGGIQPECCLCSYWWVHLRYSRKTDILILRYVTAS